MIDVDLVDRYLYRVDRVLIRARAAGLVRTELEPWDVATAVVMVLATMRRHAERRAHWRRYLALLLDGMRPAPEPLPRSRVTPGAAPPGSSPPASGR